MFDENYDADQRNKASSRSSSTSKCVIHYDGIEYTENLIAANETRYKELAHIKACREELGEKFIHRDQSSRIPINFQNGLHYHRECYANFSRARSEFKKRLPLSEIPCTENKRSHRSLELDSSGKFPNYCWFCKDSKAKRIRSKGRNIHEPVCVVKSDIKETLIQAARKRNDDTLLCLIEGDDVDLHQKGLKKHSSCYTDYTRVESSVRTRLETGGENKPHHGKS